MKYLLIVITLLIFPHTVLSDNNEVFYCISNKTIGFDPKENFRVKNYVPERFKIKINVDKKYIISEDLGYKQRHFENGDAFCIEENKWLLKREWKCINFLSNAITIDIETLRFNYSYIPVYNEESVNDDIILSFGQCERF